MKLWDGLRRGLSWLLGDPPVLEQSEDTRPGPTPMYPINISVSIEDKIRELLFLPPGAMLVLYSDALPDRHLLAASQGVLIAPYKLRTAVFPNGAQMRDYSALGAMDNGDQLGTNLGPDPLADIAGCLDHGVEGCRTCRPVSKKRK